jgi:hypothetical protein
MVADGGEFLTYAAYAPAFGFGVGVRQSRFSEELTYTHVEGRYETFGYASLRIGISPGPR